MDGLGAEAGQAPGAQPPAPRRTRHIVRAVERGRAGAARGHPLRHHARRRHADAARHGGEACRQDGAPAQPSGLRYAPSGAWSRATASSSRASPWPCRCRAGGSWFQRVFSGSPGMDPYAAPISDLYQDLFGEGSFIGKGIYDVDALEAAMEGRTPDNAILSHDLYEGIFARSGLASDVELHRGIPPPLRRRRLPDASLDAGRLAAPAVDFGRASRAASGAAPRPLEDARQPPPLAVRAIGGRGALRRLAAAAGRRACLDALRRSPRIALPSLVSNLIGFSWRSSQRSWQQTARRTRRRISGGRSCSRASSSSRLSIRPA